MLTLEVKSTRLETRKIQDKVNTQVNKGLSHAGGTVRKTAQNSLRKRKKVRKRKQVSEPGKPPTRYSELDRGLGNIRYHVRNAGRLSDGYVVVGPVKLNKVTYTVARERTTIPGLHERGETVEVLERRWVIPGKPRGHWRRVDLRRKIRPEDADKIQTRKRTVRYPARPYMRPALEKIQERLPKLFAGSITS